jgi:hypothetical protein
MSLIAGWRAPTIKDDYFALVVKRWLVLLGSALILALHAKHTEDASIFC